MEKLSLVDFPDRLAAVFFTPGCNLDCFYCHNRSLLAEEPPALISVETALGWLEGRKGLLDGVVVSGGEPTLHAALPQFLRDVRAMGFQTKLDTNGLRPQHLRPIIEEGLLDYIAMDVKAPFHRYTEITGVPLDILDLHTSIDLLLYSGIDHEFRTTVVPQLARKDIIEIGQWIRGAQRYVLQQYRKPETHGTISDLRLSAKPHPKTWPFELLDELKRYVQQCLTRGFGEAQPEAEMA